MNSTDGVDNRERRVGVRHLLVPIIALAVILSALPSVAPLAPMAAASPSLPVSAATATALAAPQTPSAAINSSVAHAQAYDITSYISVVDRTTGQVVAETANANTQVASASIMKLFLAAYYAVQAGGYGKMTGSLRASLEYMIKYSDDATASQLFTASAIPSMATRYGLSNTANAINVGHWGAARITAHDMSRFLFQVNKDGLVGPWLIPLMGQTNASGSDGFNQKFGFNALTGTHGSKQGWSSDNWTAQHNVIHSVGYTSRWFASVLQASSNTYAVMSSTATYSAQHIQASVVPAPTAHPQVPKTQATRYVNYVAKTLLNRTPTSKYSVLLQQGKITFDGVARAVVLGTEYRQRLVARAYKSCLNRAPDSAGLKSYTAAMAKGTTVALYASICSSTEARKVNGGGSFETQVKNMVKRMTGVKATNSQVTALLKTLRGSGWKAMVTQIVNSARWRTTRLNNLYQAMFGQPSTALGRGRYLGTMSKRGDFSAAIALAGSDRFWTLSQKG
ncbi:hypothetical protein D1871_23230 [Nakamurella silvestris]|nr:hypothetical protein D1871_23230 [Nakamurella silvestris]